MMSPIVPFEPIFPSLPGQLRHALRVLLLAWDYAMAVQRPPGISQWKSSSCSSLELLQATCAG
jgi:hypothetical protein